MCLITCQVSRLLPGSSTGAKPHSIICRSTRSTAKLASIWCCIELLNPRVYQDSGHSTGVPEPHFCPTSVRLNSTSNLSEAVRRVRLVLFHLKRHGARHRPDVWIVIFIDTRLERSRPNRVLRAQPEFQLHSLSGRESVEI